MFISYLMFVEVRLPTESDCSLKEERRGRGREEGREKKICRSSEELTGHPYRDRLWTLTSSRVGGFHL